MKVNIWI